jgi:hypothetical protein
MRSATVFALAALAIGLVLPQLPAHATAAADEEWPMLGHDAARSGATAAEIRPPFERKWYRFFADEGLMAGVQPIIAGGKVFVGTMAGRLHAIRADTGEDAWVFAAGGPILHTACADGGKVFFGCGDGKVYAVSAADGKRAWTAATGAAVWNAPAACDGVVLAGSRDGRLYALDSATGRVRWAAPTGGPILSSPAADARAGRVYVGSEDMHVYAFNLTDGKQAWVSDKLPGASLRGYHPTIAPDGAVMVTSAPAVSYETCGGILLDMVREVFGDFASWRHKKEDNDRLRQENFRKMADPGTYEAQLAYLRTRLAQEPAFQTFFVLDPAGGKQRFVAPIVSAESMNGPAAPPVVTPAGKVIVKYQALLRSRYEHYSPFLNVGYLDTATGSVAPIMDQTRTYGWHDSLLLVHDEQCQLTAAGKVLINTHQDNVNAMDLGTLKGYLDPFCRNVHEPAKGEAVGIWACLLRGQPVPVGKEWLERGTAVYGGGSVIDVPVSVAGDSFYYVPMHEINSGCAVIAYRMQPGGGASKQSPPPSARLTDDEFKRIRRMPWDWDILGTPRLKNVLDALPGPIAGTRHAPLRDEAEAVRAKMAAAELDKFIWEARLPVRPDDATANLRADLARLVEELISQDWRPLVFPAGKHPVESYRFFTEPTETLYALARAYPYLPNDLKAGVRDYVAKAGAAGGPLDGLTGRPAYQRDAGEVRCLYDVPPERLVNVRDDITRSPLARLYPLWLWAHVTGDWGRIERDWKSLRALANEAPNEPQEDCRNGYVAGLIAYSRMARRMNDEAALEDGAAKARGAMGDRLAYEFAHPSGGAVTEVPAGRTIFGRWRHLTPEVGRLLAAYALPTQKHLVDVYVDHHRPTWWLAWNVEIMWRNETPYAFPTVSAEVFAARALVLGEPPDKLCRFLDIPWCRADLMHVQKLVLCLEAGGEAAWQDLRR